MSWFYLALLAPVLYAITNLIDDILVQSEDTSPYLVAIVGGLFGALPWLTRPFLHADPIPLSVATLGVTAGFLTSLYYFFYLKALTLESPSVVIALFALTPATVPILAHFLLHEHLAGMQIVGLVIVLVASLGLTLKKEKKYSLSKAIVPAMTVVVLLDIISILSKYTYDRASFYPVYLAYSAGMGLGGIFFVLVVRRLHDQSVFRSLRTIFRKYLGLFILAELFILAAEFVLNLAISKGPVSLVRVIEGIQPMFVLLIALILSPIWPKHFREAKEGNIVRKLSLMAVIVLGLYLIQRTSL